ncbi:MAG: hypothetical protein RBT80_19135 [Candidatus Vecturithrix sp.]|jgi:hypothetical protein|nr:hypothetical protein [Candidatus Vecturithrix sp.]
MTEQANVRKTFQERQLLDIVRRLPRDLVSQVINFAQFLEFQQAKTYQEPQEQAEHVAEGNAKWDTLLASDDAQRLLYFAAPTGLLTHPFRLMCSETRPGTPC